MKPAPLSWHLTFLDAVVHKDLVVHDHQSEMGLSGFKLALLIFTHWQLLAGREKQFKMLCKLN